MDTAAREKHGRLQVPDSGEEPARQWLRREVERLCRRAGWRPPRLCFAAYEGGPGFVPLTRTLYLPPSLVASPHAAVIVAHEIGHLRHRVDYAREVAWLAASLCGPFALSIPAVVVAAPAYLPGALLCTAALAALGCLGNERRAAVRALRREIEADAFAVSMGHAPLAVAAALVHDLAGPPSQAIAARLAALHRLAGQGANIPIRLAAPPP